MKCPSCKGEGGGYDAILWRGIGGGPYERDEYCGGSGEVPVNAWIAWYITVWWDENIRWKIWRWGNRKIRKGG